ncbi:MAG: zinc metallopeptidase [Candidatus Gastranaerophilales bacterium]|nr:zinc metallopeptidase [Candidatus Gastranaerophilales bacterium]
MFFDSSYMLLIVVGLIITGIPQLLVKSTFTKYSKIKSEKRTTGAQVAKFLLNDAGIYNVTVEFIQGELTDHYDPTAKVLRLSESVYSSDSIAAIGVAAHEAGHAIQDNKGYVPMKLRSGIFPAVMFGQNLGPILIMVSLGLQAFMHLSGLTTLIALIGIALYGAVVVFQIVTLPVELNASNRAMHALVNGGYLTHEEAGGARNVLNAAAMTYIAAALYAILQILYYVWLLFGRNRD